LEVAALAADEFADGVCWVSLDTVRAVELVLPTIARALGLEDASDAGPLEMLQSALRERELLLVLDNFEQVIEAATAVADLLTACARLTVLVTSREPLHLRAEHEWPLSPLPTPDPSRAASAGSIRRFAAVELFVQRARAVRPDFALSDANAPAVGALCARLDGLPLAVELAAAHCRYQEPEALVAWLADRFALLADGYRDLPPRQRTMRAAITWSYDLLTSAEQAAFCRLSVFIGGFTPEGAVAVGAESSSSSTGEVLTALTEKGLLQRDDSADGPRYGMLETIREFGYEALAARGEAAAVRCAHAAYYMALAEQAGPGLTGPDQLTWLERLDIEHANLRHALDWALSDAAPDDAALRLAAPLWRFWWVRGYAREGRTWLEHALARPGTPSSAARAKALEAAAELAEALADYRRAEALYGEALALRRALGDEHGVAVCLKGLGTIARAQGALDRATSLHEQAVALFRQFGDRREAASTLNELAVVAYHRGDTDRAGELLGEAIAEFRAVGDLRAVGALLNNLGVIALMRGDPGRATELHEESLALARRIGDIQATARRILNLGKALYESGEVDRAAVTFEEALAVCRQVGDAAAEAITLYNLGKLAETRGETDLAAERFTESLSLYARSGDLPGMASCLERLGAVLLVRGLSAQAVRLFAAAAVIWTETGAAREVVDACAYERQVATARSALGEVDFGAAWAAGSCLTPDAAVTEALTATTPGCPTTAEAESSCPLGSPDREACELSARTPR
ncbi:MAG: tetratricopeptide repeat protein, partial [Chloroflexota bacterium]|nr:tetratricopeptide repeat protein [Chloroflexota bacterium]